MKIIKKFLFLKNLFVFLIFIQIGYSQSREEKNAICTKTKNFSIDDRLHKFPFCSTKEIKIISFENKNSEQMPGHELRKHIDSIILNKDKFQSDLYDEVATLNTEQIFKLTDIIYNYSFKKQPYAIEDIKCYNPRNAIIFIDSNNNIIAFLEICFGCNHFRSSSEQLDLGEYCSNKYDLIKSIFKESNIVYGITSVE